MAVGCATRRNSATNTLALWGDCQRIFACYTTGMSKQQHTPTLFQEKHFLQQILDLAALSGWLCYHVSDSHRATYRGFPDLVLLHPSKHRLLFVELKVGKNTTTPEQKEWLHLLALIPGVEVYIWTPGQWPDIERALR